MGYIYVSYSCVAPLANFLDLNIVFAHCKYFKRLYRPSWSAPVKFHLESLTKFLRNRTLYRSLIQNGGIRQWHIYQEPQCLDAGFDVSTTWYHAPRKTSTSNDQQALKFGHQARPGNSALVERTDSRVSRFSSARAKFQAAQAFQKEAR